MDKKFDELAKSLTGKQSRRTMLWRLSLGLGGAMLASAGLGQKVKGMSGDAARWCRENFSPGPTLGQCISDAARGTGPYYECGPASTSGQVFCNGVCCAAGQVCQNGVCVAASPCPPGWDYYETVEGLRVCSPPIVNVCAGIDCSSSAECIGESAYCVKGGCTTAPGTCAQVRPIPD